MLWKTPFFVLGAMTLFVDQAEAGPWPRGTGNGFFGSNASLSWPQGSSFNNPEAFVGAYAEYGLTERLTLGLDMGLSSTAQPSGLKAIGFLRYTLTEPDARHQFAVDLGGGTNFGDPVIRVGASYGSGIELFSRSGWVTIDANMLISPSNGDIASAVDATMGLNLEHGKVLGLLSFSRTATGTNSYSFTPSYAHQISDTQHFEVGVTFDLAGGADPALKFGIWQDF